MELGQQATPCRLCPRHCGAERGETEGFGLCGMPQLPVLARAALHHWEEPPISGSRGSGAVFFSGCALDCVYCQNEQISQKHFGEVVSLDRLREIFEHLISQGAQNINLVNPTHFAPAIAKVLQEPLSVPVVWNSSAYDSVSALRTLEGKIQIYLPDFKYPDEEGAELYSGARDYPQQAKRAILEMLRQTGPYAFDEAGLLRRGVMIRHLLLPGRVQEAKAVMDWVKQSVPPNTVLFSLMGQYVPCGRAREIPPLDRVLRASEGKAAIAYMQAMELEGYTQGPDAAREDYIPEFDLSGVIPL